MEKPRMDLGREAAAARISASTASVSTPPPVLAPPLGVMWGESLGKEKRPKETNGGEKA